jgi:benzil reductase ((S)-benzoin forming)
VRSVIITGISRGLGAALFDEFRGAGDRVLALGRRFTDAQHAAERQDPQRVRLRQVDLAYPTTLPPAAELSSFIHDATEVVLVLNAAVLEPMGAIGTLTGEEMQAAVAVNLTSPMVLTNAVVAAAGTRRALTVMFMSTGAALEPVAGWSVYGSTKLAGESFFAALASQPAPNIRVVTVYPGTVDTDMWGQAIAHAKRDFPNEDRFAGVGVVSASHAARRILAEHL